jgi:hypothetical protein
MRKINFVSLVLMTILLIPAFIGINAEGEIISVGINEGAKKQEAVTSGIEKALDNYSWVVNDTEYVFYTTFMDIDYNYSHFDVHIMDGRTDELFDCARKIDKKKDDDAEELRDRLLDAIEKGNGFIGRCAGSLLPPNYDRARPDSELEYILIKQNRYMPELKIHLNSGLPIFSQFFTMRYFPFNFGRPILRVLQDPYAIGAGAYDVGGYLSTDSSAINNTRNILGVCLDLEKLEYDHPILEGYLGDTLYTRAIGGGGFKKLFLPKYVTPLAWYPNNCFKDDPNQEVTAWKCRPITTSMVVLLRMFIDLLKENLGSILSVDDIPYEWRCLFKDDDEDGKDFWNLLNKIAMDVPWWYKLQNDNDEINPEVQGKAAIIAFQYDDNDNYGRVVLSGPHIASRIWEDKDAYTVDADNDGFLMNDGSLGVNISEGLYHWKDSDGNWLEDFGANNDTDDLVWNEELYWYQRREAAWAAGEDIVPDGHLPPVYNKSEVVDIDPYRWDSD